MAKQIYAPTIDELYEIQDMGINVYNYLIAKVAEILTLEGVVCFHKGILNTEYKYLRENIDIVSVICRMYPREMKYSEVSKYEPSLCMSLLEDKHDNAIYRLDNLSLFDDSTTNNVHVINMVIDILARELSSNPRYRFEYKKNNLLDSIFNTEFIGNIFYSTSLLDSLSKIEPAYVLKDKNLTDSNVRAAMLKKAMQVYLSRYKLEDSSCNFRIYDGKDILTTPDQNVKRLIRCINKRGNNKY